MKHGYVTSSIALGEGARFVCETYPDNPESGPILTIDLPGGWLMLSGRAGGVEAGDVENARQLLKVVTQFAAEVERLYALAAESAGDSGDAAA
ncbi:hypothetical protein AGRA3207_007554 [Actinomadura graeca]|uniref:DUF1876 domain-containing protein n=1 Tax=Actinomadura graeca TaxID=2750812 RepID=A0ABX8R4I1_9ACTN|nr:hypothetical protein [Actinomadura graeca]QXJ25981.1 hypothetical protein AGRA3207_007554 [Actinomadura graeca]